MLLRMKIFSISILKFYIPFINFSFILLNNYVEYHRNKTEMNKRYPIILFSSIIFYTFPTFSILFYFTFFYPTLLQNI